MVKAIRIWSPVSLPKEVGRAMVLIILAATGASLSEVLGVT